MTKKKRIAFCSELGSGSGHLTGLLAVADTFVEQGNECGRTAKCLFIERIILAAEIVKGKSLHLF